jgi:hypothetical protein
VWLVRAGVPYIDVHIITGADMAQDGVAPLWIHELYGRILGSDIFHVQIAGVHTVRKPARLPFFHDRQLCLRLSCSTPPAGSNVSTCPGIAMIAVLSLSTNAVVIPDPRREDDKLSSTTFSVQHSQSQVLVIRGVVNSIAMTSCGSKHVLASK